MSVDCGQRLNWLGSFLSEAVYVDDSEMTPVFVLRICWIERLKLPVVQGILHQAAQHRIGCSTVGFAQPGGLQTSGTGYPVREGRPLQALICLEEIFQNPTRPISGEELMHAGAEITFVRTYRWRLQQTQPMVERCSTLSPKIINERV